MEAKIEIADIVNKAIKSAIMEEVNNLGIRAVVREKIESVGELNKEDVREMVHETVDSYVRSVDVDKIVQQLVDEIVTRIVERKVSAVVDRYLEGTFSCYKPTQQLEELILNDLKKQFYQTHNLKVVDTMRRE